MVFSAAGAGRGTEVKKPVRSWTKKGENRESGRSMG